MKHTIESIKSHNKQAGGYFFSKGATKFFNSRICRTVYQGAGGVYFITSEQYPLNARIYNIRRYNPETGSVDSVYDWSGGDRFRDIGDSNTAVGLARGLADGSLQPVTE